MGSMAEPRHSNVAVTDPDQPRFVSRVLKVCIGLAFYLASETWRAVLRVFGRTPTPNLVVIYYHHVPAGQRERFARQLDQLQRSTTALRADQKELLTPNGRYSMVTADDAWKSFADNAVPELIRRNIPVSIFAISNRLGQSVDGVTFDRLVSADELRGLDANVVTIGSHTANHAVMTTLDEPDAVRELRESREQLGSILGHDVTSFCFPYGEYRDDLISLCREAGYNRVFTCEPVLANPTEYALGRVRVDADNWPLEFYLKLMGAYRWLPMAIALKRKLLATIRGGSHVSEQSPEIPSA
jgi:peptidoglycan/xylan/chitin deacetylase (PgdA/CDA1 family)